jgi:hypothetical protein
MGHRDDARKRSGGDIMPIKTVANDIANQLSTDGLGTVGTDIFRGPTRAFTQDSDGVDLIPRDAIFVALPTPGPDPIPMAGTAYQDVRTAAVQIIVRNTDTASTVAEEVYNALAVATPAEYIALEMIGSGPAYLPGIDPNQDNLWSINLHAIYDQRDTTSGDGELDFSDADDSAWLTILFSRP